MNNLIQTFSNFTVFLVTSPIETFGCVIDGNGCHTRSYVIDNESLLDQAKQALTDTQAVLGIAPNVNVLPLMTKTQYDSMVTLTSTMSEAE